MGSRLRENPQKIFECFVEVVPSTEPKIAPWVLQRFPDDYGDQSSKVLKSLHRYDNPTSYRGPPEYNVVTALTQAGRAHPILNITEEVLKSVSHFCYPCDISSTVVQVFSFVLTGADSKWTFGYCRHTPKAPTAICLLSSLPWHETFYELLNKIADITQRQEASDLGHFLECLYEAEVPDPGGVLVFKPGFCVQDQRFQCSDHTKLPSIPENRNVSEYFNAVDAQNMMVIFASMLNERRILITSNKLSRLSACVQSANALIYPMHWQHIFIPILPTNLLDYLSAPMPFLIGVPSVLLEKAPKLDFSEIVVLYADQNKVETPFDDLQNLPPEVVSSLKRKLKNSTALLGDRVARAFLYSLVQLIGGYRDALDFGEKITFNRDAFIQTRTPSMQPFLQRMLQLQIFQEFIEERLDMLNAGEGFNDEFEFQVNLYAEKSSAKLRNQYKEWMSSMKKEGGAFLKSVKNKANPAVKHAYKSVKDRSKKAYKGVRSKIQELQQKEVAGDGSLPSPVGNLKSRQPRSAPSSPTLLRSRPATFHGLKFTWDRFPHPADKPRQYNLLDVSAETTPEPAQDDTEELSRSSSPNLTLRRISMDLMGDLQDIIFRRCSVGDSTNGEQSLKSAASSESVQRGSPSPVPTPTHGGDGLTPIPPPRTKRRGAASTKAASQGTSTPEPTAVADESAFQDRLLILLDAEDEPEEVFDPLLQPKSSATAVTTTTTPLPQTTNCVKDACLTSASHPLPMASSFHHQPPSYCSSPIPFQPMMMPPPPSSSSMCVTMMGTSPASATYMNAAAPNVGPRFSTFHPMAAASSLPTIQHCGLQPSPFSSATVPTNPFSTAVPAPILQPGFASGPPAIPSHNFVPVPVVVDSFGTQSLGVPIFQSTNPFADAAAVAVPAVGMGGNSHPIVPNLKSTARPKVPPPPRPAPPAHPNNRNTVADPFSSGASWDGRTTAADRREWETFN